MCQEHRRDWFRLLPGGRPPRPIQIGIGLRGTSGIRSVGLWWLLDRLGFEIDYSSWLFSTQAELQSVMRRTWQSAVIPIKEHTWGDPEVLRQLVDLYWTERQSDLAPAQTRELIYAARDAFADGDYAEASKLFSLVPADALSGPDVVRARIARARVSSGGPGVA